MSFEKNSKTTPELKRVVAYVRSATMAKRSVRSQIRRIRDFVLETGEQNACLDSVFRDIGVSGLTSERPQLAFLLAEIQQGTIARVVVTDAARLSRSASDLHEIIRFMEAHACSLVSLDHGLLTSLGDAV